METTVAAQGARAVVIYDGKCPMCTFQSRFIGYADFLHRLEMLPAQDARVQALAPHLTYADLMSAMHVVTPERKIHRGARAIRYIAARLPLLWPLCILLWIPGAIYLSEFIYRIVSRNRYVLSKVFGCKTACAVLPKKKNGE
jgi:predicted DCC family thiol-disulfide oxidoreductase YuxK